MSAQDKVLCPRDGTAQKAASLSTWEGSGVVVTAFLTGTKKSVFALAPSSLGVGHIGWADMRAAALPPGGDTIGAG